MIVMTDIVNNVLVTMKYIGYTRREAQRLFRQYVRTISNK